MARDYHRYRIESHRVAYCPGRITASDLSREFPVRDRPPVTDFLQRGPDRLLKPRAVESDLQRKV